MLTAAVSWRAEEQTDDLIPRACEQAIVARGCYLPAGILMKGKLLFGHDVQA